MSWNNQAVQLLVLQEATGGWSGVFGYSPTPGKGNLVFSVAAAAGSDPYGNAYPAGVSTTAGAGTIEGPDYVIDSAGGFWYSGTPAAGNLILSMSGAAGTDPYGNTYPQGLAFAKGTVPGGLIDPGTVGTTQIDFTARDIGGITTSIAASAPAGAETGDLWYDSANGYKLNQYDGSAWTAYQYGTNAIAAGSITAALIAANTITAAQIAAGTITAGQIAAGTITASQIAANGITASLIGSLGPLNPNPFLTGGDDTTWFANNATSSGVTSSPPAGAPYPYAYEAVSDGSAGFLVGQLKAAGSGAFSVVGGAQYFVSGWLYSSAALTFNVGLTWLSSSDGIVSTSEAPNTVPADTWTQVVAVVTAPSAGVAMARVIVSPATTAASGTTVYVAGMTVSPQVPGTLIEADSITAGQIAAGTITAAQIAAGTIVAGIVDGTTITGAQIVADGTSGEFLVYSGTPGSGNLIASVSAAAGTDPYGNAYPAGITVGLATGNQVQMAVPAGIAQLMFPLNVTGFEAPHLESGMVGSGSTEYAALVIQGPQDTAHPDYMGVQLNSSDGTSTANLDFIYNSTSSPAVATEMAYCDNTGFNVIAGSVRGAAPGSNPATPASWGGLGVPSGWTGLLTAGGGSQGGRYLKLAEQQAVWIDIAMTAPSAGSGTTVTFPYSIPANQSPQYGPRNFPVAINASTAENSRVNIGTNGVVEILGLPSGFTGSVSASFMIPLD
jgi:hypothetical protein